MITRLIVLLLVSGVLFPGAVRMASAESREELTRQVCEAEKAFASTMADRDFARFASFISEEAIFFGRSGTLCGKAAVLQAWKGFFGGSKAPFSWEPSFVEVLDSGMLAITSGPVRDPDGRESGTFNSIWRRETDGSWKVIFDKGCPSCK